MLAVALLLCSPVGLTRAQVPDPALARLVRPAPGTRPLGAVLAELSRQGHLPLSYSSSLVPVARPCHLAAGPARPMGVVLAEVLAAEHLSFGLLDGQLVLWPAHLAVPAGVASVNGRPTRPAQLTHSAVAALASGGAGGITKIAAAGSRPAGQYAPTPEAGEAFPPVPTRHGKGAVVRPEAAIVDSNPLAKRASPGVAAAATATQFQTKASGRLSTEARNIAPASVVKRAFIAKRAVVRPRTGTIGTVQPSAAPRSARSLVSSQAGSSAAKSASAKSAIAGSPVGGSIRRSAATKANTGSVQTGGQPEAVRTRVAKQPPRHSDPVRGPVASLTSIAIVPTPIPEPDRIPLTIQVLEGQGFEQTRSFAAGTDNSAPTTANTPFALASLLHPSYLHAEAWVSETLPLGAAVKVGIPRIYLTLGVAAGPLGRQSGGVAGGGGLGTAGQPRGRFTPSLDLLQWFLSGDRETPGSQLTQLRPLLAWQIKQGGRLQLMGGPTLNLGTGMHRDGGRPRGDGELGQGQWLWLNAGDEHSFVRLWPGVQLGLRF